MCLLGFFPLSGLLLHVLPTPTSAAGSALASGCSGCCCEQRVWAPGALLLCCSLFAHVAKGIVDPLLVTAQTCSYRKSLGDKLVMIFCPSSALLPLALHTLGLVPRVRALTAWLRPFAPNDSGEHPSENKRGGFVEANICSCACRYQTGTLAYPLEGERQLSRLAGWCSHRWLVVAAGVDFVHAGYQMLRVAGSTPPKQGAQARAGPC